jgi:hypothetical protein
MKKKSIFALILLFLISNIAVSQNVKIKGNANVPNALVRLLTYDDMLTYEQNLVSETKSDDKGDFFIETEISDVTMAQIAVNLERVDLLIKPDATLSEILLLSRKYQNCNLLYELFRLE